MPLQVQFKICNFYVWKYFCRPRAKKTAAQHGDFEDFGDFADSDVQIEPELTEARKVRFNCVPGTHKKT